MNLKGLGHDELVYLLGALSVFGELVEPPSRDVKAKARNKVTCALVAGIVKKPLTCTLCHKKGKLEAHHEDYDKPLDIVWLCRSCHGKRHQERYRDGLDAPKRRFMSAQPIYDLEFYKKKVVG